MIATALGRIRRIGLDTVTNYELLTTSAYSALDPAGTTGAAPDSVLLDQAFTIPNADEITAEGLRIDFTRDCPFFWGVIVKVRPTYDATIDNTTALELWTHSSATNAWTLRRAIQLRNPFVGTPSGEAKFFDLRLAVPLTKIDFVWITMAPMLDGDTPVMRFIALHAYGRCHERSITRGSCEDDPDIECIGDGGDEEPIDPLDCHDFGPEVCDIPPFDWPRTGGGGPQPSSGGGPGGWDAPDMPLTDLCDPIALQELRDSMTAEQLAYFDSLLSDIELPCLEEDGETQQELPINEDDDGTPLLARQPLETYYNPEGEPEDDPRNPSPAGENTENGTVWKFPFFLFYNQAREDKFVTLLGNDPARVQAAWAHENRTSVLFGADAGQRHTSISRITASLTGLVPGMRVGFRLATKYAAEAFMASGVTTSQNVPFPFLNPFAGAPILLSTSDADADPPESGFLPLPAAQTLTATAFFGGSVSWLPDTFGLEPAVPEFSGLQDVQSVSPAEAFLVYTRTAWGGQTDFTLKPANPHNNFSEIGPPSWSWQGSDKMCSAAVSGGIGDITVMQYFMFAFLLEVWVFVPTSLFAVSVPHATCVVTPTAADAITDITAVFTSVPAVTSVTEVFDQDPYD